MTSLSPFLRCLAALGRGRQSWGNRHPPQHPPHPPSGQGLGRQPSLPATVSGPMAASAQLSASGLPGQSGLRARWAGGGVSPQLFSRLHHYQVPRVVDPPVQLVVVLLGVAFRSPVAKPLPWEAQGRGLGPPPSPLGHTGDSVCAPALSWGRAVCSQSNGEALGHEWGLGSAWGGGPTFSWSTRAPCFRIFFLAR